MAALLKTLIWALELLLLMIPPASTCCKSQFIRSQNINRSIEVGMNMGSKTEAINDNLRAALSHRPSQLITALHLEFGVREGLSIRFLANLTGAATQWDGFDSFEGLPESSSDQLSGLGDWKPGRFSTKGRLPVVPSHVRLHKGWFNATLPPFLDEQLRLNKHAAVGFMNMDADLYSSTRTVFDAVFSRCMHRIGTVISFDELFGTLAILKHEWKALNEAKEQYNFFPLRLLFHRARVAFCPLSHPDRWMRRHVRIELPRSNVCYVTAICGDRCGIFFTILALIS